ncbi:MAG: hypothetical protein ACHQT8_02190 [Chlamydiales bacterium]
MRILHTESSAGWGGQEMRILRESEGLRARGHEISFAIAKNGGLVARARKEGFSVKELSFKRHRAFMDVFALARIIRKE